MSADPMQLLAAELGQATTPDVFHRGLRQALGSFDQLNNQIIADRRVQLACRAGCSLCCWLRVDVYAHEVLLIADHLRTEFSPTELAEVRARLSAHAGRVRPLTPFDHATQNICCPLLQNGRCSIYDVRPHSCRRHHSQDFAACQYTYDHPTDLEFPGAHDRALFRTLSAAMLQGSEVYAQLGFDDTIYELGTALAEALESPDCGTRWRARRKAFRQASETPAG